MQIHELTSRKPVNENFMTNLAKAAGSAVKSTVGGAVQGVKDKAGQLGAQLKDPKAWVSTKAAAAAKGGAQLKQQTARYAEQLAGEWAQQSKQLVGAEAKAKLAQQKQPSAAQPTQSAPGGARPPATQPSGIPPAPTKPGAPGQMSQTVAKSKPGQQMQQLFGKPKGGIQDMDSDLQEAFSDLPGAKPQAGGPVDPRVTQGVGRQGNPLTSAYITAFKKWADSKLSTRESNTGETINMQRVAAENPQVDKGLRLALANIYNTRQDPKANEQAVTAYLTQAITAIQQIAAKLRSENPKSAARGKAKSMPGQMDSQTAQMARAMNLSQDNLDKMKQVIDAAGEKVTSGTGSPTLDNLLVASGLLK